MDKISIIIPVYNVEPYVKRCLDSIINQTYKNLEVLIINDGSTDNSGHICDEYAAKDNRIRVIHKANGGLSTALNVGLINYTGDYFGIVDSDDWIEPDMYELLYDTAKRSNVPISVSGYYKSTDTESVSMENLKLIPNGTISTENMLLYPLQRDDYMGFCGYVWNKLYNADIVKKSGLRFDENIRYGMDVLFFASVALAGHCTGAYINKPLYHYYQRSTAISKSKSVDIRQDIMIAYKKIEELLNDSIYESISYWARGFYCYHASVVAEIALENNDKTTFRKMQSEINKYINDYKRTNENHPEKLERINGILNR